MEINLHNTEKIVFLNGIPTRIWEGFTSSGIPVHAYIARIAVGDREIQEEFERELEECCAPSAEIGAIPMRFIL